MEIAGPGFINSGCKPTPRQAVVAEVLPAATSSAARPNGQRVMVEFVSANPTGPLRRAMAPGRLGDAICNLLETQGWR